MHFHIFFNEIILISIFKMISKLLRTNILAIRCVENLVFVGMGPILYIFEKDSYQLKYNLDCLYSNNIHGIVLGPNNKLAVFGAKSICICNILEEKEIICKKQITDQFNDWIIAVEWISSKGQAQLVILFAHNYVRIYNILDGSSRLECCKEKCILYGGSISGTSDENLVIFSGTVFQEILIWQINNDPGNNENVPVLHRLTGHKGVIFSVVYCPFSRLVCSTSDDRTVRLWKVTERNTSESSHVNWQMAEITLMKTMFSHTARVWRAVIRNDIIITIGEDSLMCTWSLTGDLLNKVHSHHGAPIWSIDVTKHNEKIFTGGADGSVYVWPTRCCNSSKIISLSTNDKNNVPKYISYLSSGTILIFNEKGMLFCYDKEETTPKASLYLEKYCTYCIMQVSPCRTFVAFVSKEGEITIYDEINKKKTWRLRQLIEEKIMESQIFSLQWLRNDTLIACGTNGLLKIFNFTMIIFGGEIRIEAQCILPPSRERWLTAAVFYEELLVCGDRAGNVHVFELSDVDEDVKPVQTFTKVHGKIGVQSFSVVNGKLMTTGRDGMLRFYELNGDKKRLLMLHKKKMPMDWISGTLTYYETVFVLGFKEVEFMIYDLLYERVLIRVSCGGGHRSWDCIVSDETASFAYIRNKQVYVFDYPLKSLKLPILQNGFHTKETCCLQRVLRLDAQDIFISGSEDCSLRISCVSETSQNDSYTFNNLGTFDGHLSGIKCISIVKLQNDVSDKINNRYLMFSGGGRAQLKVWEMNFKYDQRISSYIDLSCSDIKSHMLYGQDKYRRKPWQETKQLYIMEPETRYMDICAYYPSEHLKYVLIFVACADGYLRLFVYDIQTSNTYLKVSAKYVNRCILKMHVLVYKCKIIVLTMTTDGVLRFFDFTDTVSKIYEDAYSENEDNVDFNNAPFAEFGLHQSGINSFDLKSADEDKYFLITGGDDNLLNFVCFQICISENDKLQSLILSKWNTASAHSAQITGVKFRNENQICSVGIDQQVIIYNYFWRNGVLSANILNEVFTSVTDVQGMDLWSSDNEYYVHTAARISYAYMEEDLKYCPFEISQKLLFE